MFEVAIDLPMTMREEFDEMEILDQKLLMSTIPGLKGDLFNPKLGYYDFKKFEHQLPYEFLYEEWFVATIFGSSNCKVNKRKFVKRLSTKAKMDFVFNSFDLRQKFKQTQEFYNSKQRRRVREQMLGRRDETQEDCEHLKEDKRSPFQ
jgi:hypothetical protein